MAPQEWNRDRNVQQNYVQFLPGTATCGILFLDPTQMERVGDLAVVLKHSRYQAVQ